MLFPADGRLSTLSSRSRFPKAAVQRIGSSPLMQLLASTRPVSESLARLPGSLLTGELAVVGSWLDTFDPPAGAGRRRGGRAEGFSSDLGRWFAAVPSLRVPIGGE